jgi:hypothetical protein
MHRTYWTAAAAIGSITMAAGLTWIGCGTRGDDCYLNGLCGNGGAGGAGGSGGTGGTGGDGGKPLHCVPADDPTIPVDVNCGVFVSATGKDENTGEREAPVQTLSHALELSKGKPIYACASATPFKEPLLVSAGTVIYGGLDCSSWKYIGDKAKTELTAEAGEIPLHLQMGASTTALFDLYVSAAAAKNPGESSVAVVADQAAATFTRCTLVAQDAADGEAGTSGGDQAMQAEGGVKGDDAGVVGTSKGGAGGTNMTCNLLGGKGGNGGAIASGNGQDGEAGDNGNGGTKGSGDTGAGCNLDGDPKGANGMSMAFGPPVPGPGTIDSTGYHGVDGKPGADGTNGTSGGGGGGSKATVTAHGAGGGGGGAGGCGGKHGEGGKAGGSSVALVSLNATIAFANCKLTTGKGGKGGDGGDGQFGQPGGKAGDGGSAMAGATKGCNGGSGGDGGNGGNGSGGLGGHSLGIALTGAAPAFDDLTKKASLFGAFGAGGKGGLMDADMNHGAPGNAAVCWDFGKNKSCEQ